MAAISHNMLKTPVLKRSLKLGTKQYSDCSVLRRGPAGNTEYVWLFRCQGIVQACAVGTHNNKHSFSCRAVAFVTSWASGMSHVRTILNEVVLSDHIRCHVRA